MGANQRGQGAGRTHRAIVPDIVLLVVMPGFSGTNAQQQHDAQQRNGTGEGCTSHEFNRSRQWGVPRTLACNVRSSMQRLHERPRIVAHQVEIGRRRTVGVGERAGIERTPTVASVSSAIRLRSRGSATFSVNTARIP